MGTMKPLVILGVVSGMILAVLSLASYLVMYEDIKTDERSAAVVNVSGRQRMLVKKAALYSLQLADAKDSFERTEIRRELAKIADLLEKVHKGLINGDRELGLPGTSSAFVKEIYFGSRRRLDDLMAKFVSETKALGADPAAPVSSDDPHLKQILRLAHSELSDSLEALVRQFQKDSETNVANLLHVQKIITSGSLLLLIGMSLFIFRPLVRRIRKETSLLIRSEAYTRSIFDKMTEGLIITDESGIIRNHNPATGKIFGYSPGELYGLEIETLIPGYTRGIMENPAMAEVWAGNSVTNGYQTRDFQGKRKDGSEIPLDISVSDMFLEGSRHIINLVSDTSERKKVEETMRSLTKAIETIKLGITITDIDGKIVYTNPADAVQHGYTVKELIGRDVRIFAPEELTKTVEFEEINKNKFERRESINVRKDGTRFPVYLISDVVTDTSGEPIGMVTTCEDVTEQKKAANELKQAKIKAEAANLAKSEFLASVSHEIRTPLTAVIGMAELLSESELNHEQKKYVEICRRAGDNLLNLISDILDLSRIEAGHMDVREEDFNISEIMEKSVEILSVRAREKGLDLKWQIGPGVPEFMRGDATHVRQVLVNLISNAVKFTEEGEITVTVYREEKCKGIRSERKKKEKKCLLGFCVSDTGIGISEEKMGRIFEDFFQGDPSVTRRYGGTGLGLAISGKIVEKMGGRIWAESEPGVGSTFCFTVPVECVERKKTAKRLRDLDLLKGLKVLVIDDDETSRLILEKMMSRNKLDVTLTDKGKNGLAELRRAALAGNPYRVILLDYDMDGMNGYETAKAIRSDDSLSDAAIIILASEIRKETIARFEKLGIASYLIRPVRKADLFEAVLSIVGRVKTAEIEPPEKTTGKDADHVRPLNILLVEDSEDIQLLLRSFLQNIPHSLEIAENGQIGVQKFISGEYDIILMDMQMPVMDGYTATRRIRDWEREKGALPTPIIALTAHALKEDKKKSLDAGCTAYLSKPVKKPALLKTIFEQIEGGRAAST